MSIDAVRQIVELGNMSRSALSSERTSDRYAACGHTLVTHIRRETSHGDTTSHDRGHCLDRRRWRGVHIRRDGATAGGIDELDNVIRAT